MIERDKKEMDRRHRNLIPENVQRRITKIFVTNLPEGCSGSDLASQVRSFGQIFDLYIARKRDKGGNRFGFVSMLDVKDKDGLLKNLRSIRMGENKLWFNIARFVLEDGEINSQGDKSGPTKSGNMNLKEGEGHRVTGERSFKDMLVGNHSGVRAGAVETGERSFKDMHVGKTISIDSNVNAFSSLHGRAIVAKMIDIEALKNIYVTLNDICPGLGKVQYLGGLDVLILFEDSEVAVNVLEAARDVVDKFSMIQIWEGQSLGFERMAWLKVQGIPLHLLTNEVIDIVGGMFGKVVHKANRSENDTDLSFEYVGVLVGDGKRVFEDIVLNWKNRKFSVWVMEELRDWIVEFTKVKAEQENDESVSGDSASDASLDDDSVDGDMPEVQQEKKVAGEEGSGEESVGNGRSAANQGDCIPGPTGEKDMENNSPLCQEPLIKEGGNHGEFIPGPNFEFENNLGGEGDCITDSHNVSKRKKIKKWVDMGRPSNYSSSGSHKLQGKKARTNDPFGLNDLLGLEDDDDDNSETEESLDLNAPPGGDNRTSTDEHLNGVEEEVNATIALGELLGVRLTNFKGMVRDTIVKECLQRDKA